MKDIKVERVRQGAAMLRRQFLQGDAGVFDEVNNRGQTTNFCETLASMSLPGRNSLKRRASARAFLSCQPSLPRFFASISRCALSAIHSVRPNR